MSPEGNAGLAAGALASPPGRKLVLVVWLFVGIVVAMLALVVVSLGMLSSGRAIVAAEAIWAKAQKDALYHLSRYAEDARESDYLAFTRAIEVPLAARTAREEFLKAEPDLDVVRRELVRAGIDPSDIDGMVQLAWRLRHFGPMEEALALWKQSDERVDALVALARKLHSEGVYSEPQRREALAQIDLIQSRIAQHQGEFSASLGSALRAGKSLLILGLLAVGGLLLLVAIAVARRILTQSENLQKTLLENESQLRNLIESAPLPLLIVRRRDEHILYANERALHLFGLTPAQVRAREMSDFYAEPGERETVMQAIDSIGSVRDREVEMKDRSGRRVWVLLSAQRIRYGGEACLLKTLHNIDDRKRMQDDMRHRAMHDTLTNLPNRGMFMEALDRALRRSKRRQNRISVLFIDLDRFKVINDTLGHQAGDQLLTAVAERLRSAVRDSDLVARLGGDEFVVLIEDHAGPEEVMIVAQKILQMLDRPVLIEWREVHISCSIGIAAYPDDGEEVDVLMKNADIAMYQAKERGRNNFQFYSPELNKLTLQRLELETRLKGALERNEFFLQYQPEIDLATGKVLGVEALLRWQDPKTELVMPVDFIPLAEETGTIIQIGRWVLDQALADLKRWRDQGLDIYVSVNISARQFQHHDLLNEVFQALQNHHVSAKHLRLEVTETMMMHDPPAAERALSALKGLGVELAVDDFGTGFSSLSLVRRFPIHVVKIDKSFVGGCPHNRECVAIVQAVSAMAYTLGLRVVAEGVETQEQLDMIAAFGCDGAQGFLFSRPVVAAGVPWLVSDPPELRIAPPQLHHFPANTAAG
ncbi:MAG: putative bifunctional diguanylate cyclase/phosphodiesterase [Bacillota bacterium]